MKIKLYGSEKRRPIHVQFPDIIEYPLKFISGHTEEVKQMQYELQSA